MTPSLPDVNSLVRDIAEAAPVRLREIDTVFQALSQLRSEDAAKRAVYFYVTDSEERLIGVAPVRRLLLAEPSTLVGELIVHPVISVSESETFGQALRLLAEQRLLALPVVNARGQLTGVLDVSDITGTLFHMERHETAEHFYQLSGVRLQQQPDRAFSLSERCSCALVSIAGGLLAALTLNILRTTRAAEVLCLIPLIMMFGEAIAAQTVTISLQGLHAIPPKPREMWRDIGKGLLLSVTSALLVGMLISGWANLSRLAMIAAFSLVTAGLSGAILGYGVPRLLRHLGLHSKLASGPAVLALTHLASLAGYLGFCKALVG